MTLEQSPHPLVLRYAFNAREYQLLHHYLIRRLRRDPWRSPQAGPDDEPFAINDNYHAAAFRSSLRVFLGTSAGLKAWDLISASLSGHNRFPR